MPTLPFQNQAKRTPWPLLLLLVLLLAVAASVAWMLERFEREALRLAQSQLRVNVNALHHEIANVWLPSQFAKARIMAAELGAEAPLQPTLKPALQPRLQAQLETRHLDNPLTTATPQQ